MTSEIPACGRIGCDIDDDHTHSDWQVGDRVVVEPKLATAPGWAFRSPRGTIVASGHLDGTTVVVTVALDDGGPVEVDRRLLTRQRTFDQRDARRRSRKPTEKPRKEALDPELFDEPTLGDYMLGRVV